MKRNVLALWALVLGLVASGGLQAQDNPAYTLAVGDVVNIHVFDEPDLSMERVQINDTGTIQFPFIGEIKATGRTAMQVQQAIVSALQPDYLVDPKVTVSIVEYRPFFLNGEVNKPGSYPYVPGMTLRQAITIAGGLTERASKNKMSVVPAGKVQNTQNAEKIDMDYPIKPGDTITIDQSFF